MLVRATRTVEFEISVHKQLKYDASACMRSGVYAFVGHPGEQSDFCVGPYKTAKEARVAACERLRRMGFDLVEKKR